MNLAKYKLAAILLAFGFNIVVAPAQALSVDKVQVASLPSKDGFSFLNNLLDAVRALNDYTYDTELTTYKPGNTTLMTGRFSYKRTDLVRIEVTGTGYKAGSVVVRSPDGKISARGGGMLSHLKLTLAEDSRMLQLPNGLNVVKSDFASLLAQAKNEVSSGFKSRVTDPVLIDEFKEKVIILDILSQANSQGEIAERIYLSADSVPVAWDIYKEGKLFSRVRFLNIKVNPGLGPDLFKI
jgi:outer membrane lipoprotein-sorting protein